MYNVASAKLTYVACKNSTLEASRRQRQMGLKANMVNTATSRTAKNTHETLSQQNKQMKQEQIHMEFQRFEIIPYINISFLICFLKQCLTYSRLASGLLRVENDLEL